MGNYRTMMQDDGSYEIQELVNGFWHTVTTCDTIKDAKEKLNILRDLDEEAANEQCD
jgi:hypothetical protein